MSVILARRVDSGTNGGAVHAFELDLDDNPPAELHAPCGASLGVDEIEQVEQFTGAPCMVCLMLALGGDDTSAPEIAPDLPPAETPAVDPDDEPESGYLYGIALRGDQVTHLVEPGAIRGTLDERSVVQTLCRVLAWGPSKVAAGWPTCQECAESRA